MSADFNVNEYWLERGRDYAREDLPAEFHRLQESFLFDILESSGLQFRKILELGCGFGRITKLLAQHFPQAAILAIDLSPDQLRNARQYCAGLGNVQFEPYDFYSGLPFPGKGYDAAIAVEVFLHHPDKLLRPLVEKLSAVTSVIINIDWSENWPWQRPDHVWLHDYPAIYAEAGWQCLAFPLPKKIAGQQQQLFFAGPELPAALRARAQAAERRAKDPESSGPQRPPAAEWTEMIARCIREICSLVPAGSSLILVNEDQWGYAETGLAGRRLIPFPEHDGQYWGLPCDSASAIDELERLRQQGAAYLVFPWHCHWWLKEYPEFETHLRKNYPCVCENDSLTAFDLA